MMAALSILEVAGTITAVVTMLLATFALIDKLTGWMSGWVERRVESGTAGLKHDLQTHKEYVGYHLGPNGETTPIHERLMALEHAAGVTPRDRRQASDEAAGETT